MGSRCKSLLKGALKCAFVLSVGAVTLSGHQEITHAAAAKGSTESSESLQKAITPVQGPYGYFVDH